MLVSKLPPAVVRSKVYVTDTEYEIWYSKPIQLGTVRKIGHFWYTVDACRHKSARLAMLYLTDLHDRGQKPVPQALPVPRKRVKKVSNHDPLLEKIKSELDLNDPLVVSILRMLAEARKERDSDGKIH